MPRVASYAPISSAALVALLSLALTAPCNAQLGQSGGVKAAPTNYILSIGLGGGTVIPTGNGSSSLNHGTNIQGYALVKLPGFVCLRFNLGYQKFNFANAVEGGSEYNGSSQQILNGTGGVQFNLFSLGPVRPYLVAGLGAYKYTTNSDTTPGASPVSSLNFGINGGGGIAVHIGRFSAFGEGIVQNVYTNGGGFVKSSKNIAAVPVTFGVTFGLL